MSLGRFLSKSSVERLYNELYSSGDKLQSQLDGVTRRQFLGRATASALAAGPLSSFATSLLSPFYISYQQGKAIVWRGEKPAWIVDSAEFEGTPRLIVHRTAQRTVLTLHDARFPGTSLAADLSALIERYPIPNIRIELAGLNLLFEGPLLPWIDGESDLTATNRASFVQNFAVGTFRLFPVGRASFRPDWSLRFDAPGVAEYDADSSYSADSSTFQLSSKRHAEMGGHHSAAFSITMARGNNQWKKADIRSSQGWTIEMQPGGFDQVEILLAGSEGSREEFHVMSQSREQIGAFLHLGSDFRVSGTTSGPVPLSNLMHVEAASGQKVERTLLSDFYDEVTELHADGFGIRVGKGHSRPVVRMYSDANGDDNLQVDPQLNCIHAPLPGAILQNLEADEDTRLPFSWDRLGYWFEVAGCSVLGVSCDAKNAALAMDGLKLQVVRPRDLLVLTFRFVGLELRHSHSKLRLFKRQDFKGDPLLVIEYPAQSLGEEAFLKGLADCEKIAQALLAGASQLVFRLPFVTTSNHHPRRRRRSLKYELASLLNLADGRVEVLSPLAVPRPQKPTTVVPPVMPVDPVTIIEAPHRLAMSPVEGDHDWQHTIQPQESGGNTELWHTRLRAKGTTPAQMRAIWSPRYDPGTDPKQITCGWVRDPTLGGDPFRSSLTTNDRHQIVFLSADFVNNDAPDSVNVKDLLLTSLGSTLDYSGKWNPPTGKDLERWTHRSSTCREAHVLAAYKGFLFPLGIEATLLKVTSRELRFGKKGPVAFLIQRFYVVRKDKQLFFPLCGQAFAGRQLPFGRIELVTPSTPSLDEPQPYLTGDNCTAQPTIDQRPYLFEIGALDQNGQAISFQMALIFVSNRIIRLPSRLQPLVDYYNALPEDLRFGFFNNKRIAYAPSSDPSKKQETAFETKTVTFSAGLITDATCLKELADKDLAPFYPQADSAQLGIPTVRVMSGSSATKPFRYFKRYLDGGFASLADRATTNVGEVFLEAVEPPVFNFPKDKSGGLVTPSLGVGAISRVHGVVNDAQGIAQNAFNPGRFFATGVQQLGEIKVLGDITLADILQTVESVSGRPLSVPQFLLSESNQISGDVASGLNQIQSLVNGWEQVLRAFPATAQGVLSSYDGKLRGLTTIRDQFKAQVSAQVASFNHTIGTSLEAHTIVADVADELLRGGAPPNLLQQDVIDLQKSITISLQDNVESLTSDFEAYLSDYINYPRGPWDLLVQDLQTAASDIPGFLSQAPRLLDRYKDLIDNSSASSSVQYVQDLISRADTLYQRATDEAQAVKKQLNDKKADAVAKLHAAEAKFNRDLSDLENRLDATVDQLIASLWGANSGWLTQALQAFSDAKAAVQQLQTIKTDLATYFAGVRDTVLKQIQDVLAVKSFTVHYDWHPELQDGPSGFPIFQAHNKSGPSDLAVNLIAHQIIDPKNIGNVAPPTYNVEATLKNFAVRLFPSTTFLLINVNTVRWVSKPGSSPEVKVDIPPDAVEFGPPLDFLKGLNNLLNFGGGNGLFLHVNPSGVECGYSIGFDPFPLGPFILRDLALSARLLLSFLSGEPSTVRFAVSERSRPFTLTAGIYGGGGFFGVTSTFGGTRTLEASLEFGAIAAIGVPGASGRATVRVGIYFRTEPQATTLTGFFRAEGNLRIIGMINVSLLFLLGFSYVKTQAGAQAYGECLIEVEIDFGLFSKGVSLHCQKQFAGSGGQQADAKNHAAGMAQIGSPKDWNQHLTAFHKRRRAYIGI